MYLIIYYLLFRPRSWPRTRCSAQSRALAQLRHRHHVSWQHNHLRPHRRQRGVGLQRGPGPGKGTQRLQGSLAIQRASCSPCYHLAIDTRAWLYRWQNSGLNKHTTSLSLPKLCWFLFHLFCLRFYCMHTINKDWCCSLLTHYWLWRYMRCHIIALSLNRHLKHSLNPQNHPDSFIHTGYGPRCVLCTF